MSIKSANVPVGTVAPDFTLPVATGGELSLSDYRGKRCMVLVFLRGFM